MVKWLLIINVAVWLLDMLTVWLLDMLTNSAPQMQRSFLWSWGHFSIVAAAVEQFQLWRFLSFQFLHANGHHLLVNMLGLFFFGHFAERWWGSRKFLFFYLATGVAGALFYVVLVLRRGFRLLLRYRLVEVKQYLQAIYRWWALPPAFLASWPALP